MIKIPNAINIKVVLGKSWVFDYSSNVWTINGVNTSFTIPSATQVEVWADGKLTKGGGLDYTLTSSTLITFASGRQPFSSLSVSYLPA